MEERRNVSHKKFGKGYITELTDSKITVHFTETALDKSFPYPAAFSSFLVYDDAEAQKEAEQLAKSVVTKQQAEKLKKERELAALDLARKKERQALAKKKRDAKAALEAKQKKEREIS